jgi:hypothetical protein
LREVDIDASKAEGPLEFSCRFNNPKRKIVQTNADVIPASCSRRLPAIRPSGVGIGLIYMRIWPTKVCRACSTWPGILLGDTSHREAGVISVLDADFVVSMLKVKTHHWAGVTVSRKNMFGIVPGMKYGWPKTFLHWSGIHESILDICTTVRLISSSQTVSPLWKATDLFKEAPVNWERLCLPILSRQTRPAPG